MLIAFRMNDRLPIIPQLFGYVLTTNHNMLVLAVTEKVLFPCRPFYRGGGVW